MDGFGYYHGHQPYLPHPYYQQRPPLQDRAPLPPYPPLAYPSPVAPQRSITSGEEPSHNRQQEPLNDRQYAPSYDHQQHEPSQIPIIPREERSQDRPHEPLHNHQYESLYDRQQEPSQASIVPREEPSHDHQQEQPNPTPPSPSPRPLKKRRRGITDGERKALRDYFTAQSASTDKKPSQKDLVSWFNTTYTHQVSQSSISDILSPKHAHLDSVGIAGEEGDLHFPQKMKQRKPDWPDLEEALFEWQKILSSRDVTVSGEMLKEEAARLWKRLPKYRGLEEPGWSNGWLHAFKTRYRITKYKKRMSTKKVMALAAAAKESEKTA